MRIPGIVDVYQVGDAWVARSWPKVQNQPNSAAQLLWRKKFRDAHLLVKALTGVNLAAWQNIHCPPGKMWIDIAIRTAMIYPSVLSWPTVPDGVHIGLFEVDSPNPGQRWKYFATWANADGTDSNFNFMIQPRFYGTWQKTMKWNDGGWLCARGKRPKKKWDLSFLSGQAATGDYQPGDKVPIAGSFWILGNEAVAGITTVHLVFKDATETEKSASFLAWPPMYSFLEQWNGGFF